MKPSAFLRTIWICEPPKGTLEVSHVESAMKLYLEHETRWIPVNDKLPERGQKVLVKIKTANNGDRIDIAYTNAHRQLILSLMNNYEAKYITHWRPIL